MGSTPTTTDAVGNFFTGLTSAILTGEATILEAYITAQLPIFANPFLQFLLDEGIDYIEQFFSHNLQELVAAIVIDIQTNGEKSAVYQALAQLQTAIQAGDTNAQNQALTNAINAWGGLIRSDGQTNTNQTN